MSRDDLRAMLEKIAATAGDPPEHGLDGVAARRRRRTRHRRGAVATAVALAVLGVAIYPRLGWLGEEGHDVTAAETGDRRRPAELPDVVEVYCTPDGIDVPVGSIRPQEDGLHVLVENTLTTATDVWVEADSWDSGLIRVDAGQARQLAQPVAPGPLIVGCKIAGRADQRGVELVDVNGIYDAPELECGDDEAIELEPVVIDRNNSVIAAASSGLRALGINTDDVELEHYGGYPEARYTESTVDPMVEVSDGDQLVALAHMRGNEATDRATRPPWLTVTFEGCPAFLQSGSPRGTGGTTEPPG